MLEPGGELDLLLEAIIADGGSQLGEHHLEGDRAVVVDVVRQIDRGHAPAAQLTLDLVAAGEGCAQGFEAVGQLALGEGRSKNRR